MSGWLGASMFYIVLDKTQHFYPLSCHSSASYFSITSVRRGHLDAVHRNKAFLSTYYCRHRAPHQRAPSHKLSSARLAQLKDVNSPRRPKSVQLTKLTRLSQKEQSASERYCLPF
jgi:hypothetical protein